jgi:arylsulfatase A-like enzyme
MGQFPRKFAQSALIVAVAVATMATLGIGCSRDVAQQPLPDILLITIDTLRADALEPYGATDTLTPKIAAFAEQGVVYDSATTPMPLTRPAHASILTGLYPDQHGVLTNRQILPDGVVTLAEMLRDRGYQTAAFTGVRFLNRKSGLARGFDTFRAPRKEDKIRGKDVVDRARSWLRKADLAAPLFLWVHTYDPHQPYNPVHKFRRNIDPEMEETIPWVKFSALNRVARNHDGDIPEAVLKLTLEYYRGEVEYVDFWVGRLLQTYDRLRTDRRSMVVFTADHGECFENGIFFEHADCLYEGALQVPLIVRYPDGVGAGLRVERRVSNLDIVPTVLHELALQAPANAAGVPLHDGFGGGERSAVMVRLPERHNLDRVPFRLRVIRSVVGDPIAPETDPRTRGVVELRWKYLRSPSAEFLFRLPPETVNHLAEETAIRERLQRTLEQIAAMYPSRDVASEDRDPETLEALEALGYIE